MNWNRFETITILIAEDDRFNRLLIVSLFAKYTNVEVIEAKDGREALEILSNKHVDVLLLDLYMPEMNGFETLERMRNSRSFKKIPVMVISSDDIERRRSLELGANAFIPKPFNLKGIEKQIYNLLVGEP